MEIANPTPVATDSNIDEELILSDATDSEDDLDQTAIRLNLILSILRNLCHGLR